jgi:hypothetical protein
MLYNGDFIMQKTVDWSLLNDGFTIPVSAYSSLGTWDKSILTHGTSKDIKILIDGDFYDAKLKNQNFTQANWTGHSDVIQVRYSRKSDLALKLRAIFKISYDYLYAQKQIFGKSKKQILLPEKTHEYIRLFLTTSTNILCIDCCPNELYTTLADTLKTVPEEVYESVDDIYFKEDKTSTYVQKELLIKYRKYDHSIINQLKQLYQYRDQISGERIGEQYGNSVVEAHHIEYFTKSQNNDSTNIIIVSPNYHRIIHKNNPHFNRKEFRFEFENGEKLPLKLYDHLRI